MTSNATLSRWRVDAALGAVNADINSPATAGQTLTGAVFPHPGTGRSILINAVSAGGGSLHLEAGPTSTGPFFSVRPLPILSGGVPVGTEAHHLPYEIITGAGAFYRTVFIARGASASVVVTSQGATP